LGGQKGAQEYPYRGVLQIGSEQGKNRHSPQLSGRAQNQKTKSPVNQPPIQHRRNSFPEKKKKNKKKSRKGGAQGRREMGEIKTSDESGKREGLNEGGEEGGRRKH